MAYPTEPKIEIDDLAPLATLGGYKATWQEGGMIAYAYLEPFEDQPERGYILETTYQTVSGRDPGPRQRDQGALLTSKLLELMIRHMIDAGWQTFPIPGPRSVGWQHESRLKRVKAARQVEQDQAEQRTLRVSERSGEGRRNIKGYQRTITASPVTFTCERCQSEATRTVYPGKRPQYCDACAVEVKREKTRARVARLRAGQKTI